MSSFTNDILLYFFISIAVGITYSAIAYTRKNNPWSKSTNIIFAAFRFISVSSLTFLLFAPKIKSISVNEEKPTYVFLEDNSNSIDLALDSNEISQARNQFKSLKDNLNGEIVYELLNNKEQNSTSPISNKLKDLNEKYQSQNLAGIFLLSDGINNLGPSLENLYLNTPIYTIGIGKEITLKDAFVNRVNYNKSVYLGNDFLIKANITANGYEGNSLTLELLEDEVIIDTKTEKIVNNMVSYSKLLHASKKGKRSYSLKIKPLQDEITTSNNNKRFSINIVSDQKKVLIYAQAPHPSIKMLRNIIDKDERYKSIVKYSYEKLTDSESKANLYIFCGNPKIPSSITNLNKKNGSIHLPLSNYKGLKLDWLSYRPTSKKPDEVTPIFNAKFSSFLVDQNDFNFFRSTQPLSIPFGDFSLTKGTPLLFQKFGSLDTQKPLIAVQDITLPHQAIILGEGWWRMKLYENKNDMSILEDLFFKLMDFCTSTQNEEGLFFEFNKKHYYDIETPKAQAYLTTKSGERKHNLPLSLQLKNIESGKTFDFSFILFSDRLEYSLSTLPKGNYTYTATANSNEKNYTKTGKIEIEQNDLESTNLNINLEGLKQLAINNGGEFAFYDSLSTLAIEKGKTHLSESISYKDVIDFKWIFALLSLLLFVEWIARKVKGSY